MYGTLNERQRMNLPAGMSELDLITYSPILYELYRNEGLGYDKDAFRFDPVVSTGMLASDIEYGSNMAWVNYMTPESQAMLNPGDNLVVPVNTYDNYKQLPPWEKRLSHEVSFKGNRNNQNRGESSYSGNLLNIQADQMGQKLNFVGDFSYYFDQESRAIGPIGSLSDTITPTPRGQAISTPAGTSTETPGPKGASASTTPCSYTYSAWGPCVNNGQTRTVLSQTPAGCVGTPITQQLCTPPSPSSTPSPSPTSLITTPNIGVVGVGTGTTGGTTGAGASTGGGIEYGGYLPPMGGGGGVSTGGGVEALPSEAPTTEGDAAAKDGTPVAVECTINYTPIIIGLVIGLVIGYLISKGKNKEAKPYGPSVIGAIIGAILGYVYAKHQCTPIEMLSKAGIKSKSESGYYGGR